MSDTFKTKNLVKRKRLHQTTLITEKMMDRKCGAIDDKVDKIEAVKKDLERITKEEIQEM